MYTIMCGMFDSGICFSYYKRNTYSHMMVLLLLLLVCFFLTLICLPLLRGQKENRTIRTERIALYVTCKSLRLFKVLHAYQYTCKQITIITTIICIAVCVCCCLYYALFHIVAFVRCCYLYAVHVYTVVQSAYALTLLRALWQFCPYDITHTLSRSPWVWPCIGENEWVSENERISFYSQRIRSFWRSLFWNCFALAFCERKRVR